MIGHPLQFQRHPAQHLRPGRHFAARQTFDGLTVRRRMAHRRITRQRFHVMNRPLVRPANKRPLHAAMLIAQRNFQMKHLLAVTLETEMAGLDDSRMDRADCDFVNLVAVDCEEIRDAGQRRLAGRRVSRKTIGRMKTNRLQPRMTLRHHAPLFRDLAFKPVCLRALGRQRGIGILDHHGRQRECPRARVGQHRDQTDAALVHRLAEQCGKARTVVQVGDDAVAKGGARKFRHNARLNLLGVVRDAWVALRHQKPPRVWAASCNNRLSAGGM